MTIVLLSQIRLRWTVPRMEADTFTLAVLLGLIALIAATIEYIEMVKRRIGRRADAAERAIFEERCLRGLVRVFLADARPAGNEPSATMGNG
jgi:hypothetical protein